MKASPRFCNGWRTGRFKVTDGRFFAIAQVGIGKTEDCTSRMLNFLGTGTSDKAIWSGIRFGLQKLHVYGMEDSQGRFIAIENRQTMPLSFQITWLRLDDLSINDLKAHSDALATDKEPEPDAE